MREARLRAVIGLPAYNHASRLPEALESLLLQTYPGLRIIVSDDGSTDRTAEIVADYASRDSRIVYRRTERRLGYIGNARRCFELARALFPEAEFFAWASDHDIWHPAWLERHLEQFDRHPGAVVVCPRSFRMEADGAIVKSMDADLDTTAIEPVLKRFVRTFNGMSAGNMVYGLMRADAMERAGILRWHLLPDRLLLAELSLYGSMAAAPEFLWFRRYRGLASIKRQIAASFFGKRPAHTRFAWWLSHTVTLWKEYGRAGSTDSPLTIWQGRRLAVLYGLLGLRLAQIRIWQRYGRRFLRPVVRPVRRGLRRRASLAGRALLNLPGRPHRILRPLYIRFVGRRSAG